LLLSTSLTAQRTLDYDRSVVSQVRIDLRDLGYPPVDVIPSDECAVRALTVAPNGALYGATSGKRSHLFVLFPIHGYVQPLGFLKGVTLVHRSVVVSKAGDVYIGAGDLDGHLFKYTPARDEARSIRIDAALQVTDLGIPVAGEGVYSLAIDRSRDVIYGLSSPNGQFFSYSIAAQKSTVHGSVATRRMPGEKFENERNIGRAIALDRDGNVFTSGDNGALFRFDVANQRLERLALTAPTVPGREPYNRVDAWTEDGRGTLYGGTSDGYLFRFDPKRLELVNLGKPLNQYRIRGLVLSPNGKLYGVGGDDDEMARLFSYHPGRGVYELLGMVDVNRRPYYIWQAYVIDALAIGLDGTVYLGQAERKSKLYLYYPESSRSVR
jgi:WD40 repeat protein